MLGFKACAPVLPEFINVSKTNLITYPGSLFLPYSIYLFQSLTSMSFLLSSLMFPNLSLETIVYIHDSAISLRLVKKKMLFFFLSLSM